MQNKITLALLRVKCRLCMQSPNVVLSKRTVIKCCCGKICKGTRGLKMHQRSCQVIHGLNDELCADIEEQITTDTSDDIPEKCNYDCNMGTVSDENFPELKKGLNLPKTDPEWLTANEYFKCALPINDPITSLDFNSKIKLLNDSIYNYFAENFGHTEVVPDKNMVSYYNGYSIKQLKKALKNLKSTNSDLCEIRYL